jgi:hypothetical protein
LKVLVATRQSQGKVDTDFCFCREGELLRFPALYDSDIRHSNGDDITMVGCRSSKSTTTFKVIVARYATKQEYANLIMRSYQADGWIGDDDPCKSDWDMVNRHVDILLRVAKAVAKEQSQYPYEDYVLEKDAYRFSLRTNYGPVPIKWLKRVKRKCKRVPYIKPAPVKPFVPVAPVAQVTPDPVTPDDSIEILLTI